MKKVLFILFLLINLFILGDSINLYELPKEDKQINFEKVVFENGTFEKSDFSIEEQVPIDELKVILMVYLEYPNSPIDMVPGLDKNSNNPDDYLYKPENEEYYKAYHTTKNNEILKTLNVDGYERIYVSTLTPFIEYTYSQWEFDMNKENILGVLSKNSNVGKIYVQYYQENKIYEEHRLGGVLMAGADEDVYFRTYTGDGITVGILELGIIDVNHINFQNTDITIHDQPTLNEVVDEHTTMVASIIGGTDGIANEVSFLSSQILGGVSEEIDWLCNNGADVINMSFGTQTRDGIYGGTSAYVDYASRVYNQIFITSSGNTGDANVYQGNPALAYNALTVGAVGFNQEYLSFSCYEETSNHLKPNVMMKGASLIIPGYTSNVYNGTSFSTAIVTGLSAMILEQIPALINQPMKFLSLVSSGATREVDYLYDEINNFDEKMGAGVFNYKNIIENYATAIDITTSSTSSSTIIYRQEFTLDEGETIQAAISWMSYAYKEVASSTARSDYDIRLMYNGLLESVGCSTFNNIEMVTFTAPEDESDFTIMVIQYSSQQIENEKVSFSYNITPAPEAEE